MIKRIISSCVVVPLKAEISEKVYRPDFSAEEKLFQMSGQNNVLDIMMQKPGLAQQIQANLQVVQPNGFDTSDLSDSELIDTCVDRQFDVNEVSEYVVRDLNKYKDDKK